MSDALARLVAEIAACRLCRDAPDGAPLPHEPRPVLRVSRTARILIASQAPGTRVHASGLPFDDASGDRLRGWLGVDRATFYDPARIAIAAMGFCFPGQDEAGGDLPPRRECARTWHGRLMPLLDRVELLLLVGGHAQRWHLARLGRAAMLRPTLSDTVAGWRDGLAGPAPSAIPLPHPSWRNTGWLKRNPWFEADVLPVLRAEVTRRL